MTNSVRYPEWTARGTLCYMIAHAQTAWSIRQFDLCRTDAGGAAAALAFIFHWIKTHDRTGSSRAVRETGRSLVLGPIRRRQAGGPDRPARTGARPQGLVGGHEQAAHIHSGAQTPFDNYRLSLRRPGFGILARV